jgi:hypothetical protein
VAVCAIDDESIKDITFHIWERSCQSDCLKIKLPWDYLNFTHHFKIFNEILITRSVNNVVHLWDFHNHNFLTHIEGTDFSILRKRYIAIWDPTFISFRSDRIHIYDLLRHRHVDTICLFEEMLHTVCLLGVYIDEEDSLIINTINPTYSLSSFVFNANKKKKNKKFHFF